MKKTWPDGLLEEVGISALEATTRINYAETYTSTAFAIPFLQTSNYSGWRHTGNTDPFRMLRCW